MRRRRLLVEFTGCLLGECPFVGSPLLCPRRLLAPFLVFKQPSAPPPFFSSLLLPARLAPPSPMTFLAGLLGGWGWADVSEWPNFRKGMCRTCFQAQIFASVPNRGMLPEMCDFSCSTAPPSLSVEEGNLWGLRERAQSSGTWRAASSPTLKLPAQFALLYRLG